MMPLKWDSPTVDVDRQRDLDRAERRWFVELGLVVGVLVVGSLAFVAGIAFLVLEVVR